jgi:hypothetical protein
MTETEDPGYAERDDDDFSPPTGDGVEGDGHVEDIDLDDPDLTDDDGDAEGEEDF